MNEEATQWQLSSIDEFPSFRQLWDGLNRRSGNLPILDGEFIWQLLKFFEPREARLAVLSRGGSPEAACILERTRLGVWSTYQPSQAPLGALVTSIPDAQQLCLRSLIDQLGRSVLVLGLTQLDPYFFDRPSEDPHVRSDDYIETACLETVGDFSKYWQARGKNLRQNNRKHRNRLRKAGIEPRLELVTDANMIADAVDQFGLLESAGWKSEEGTALHPNNTQGRFYRDLLANYATQERARVYQYFFDDALVASDLCLIGNRTLIILKTTYNEDQSRYSPAMLMREEQIGQLFADDNINSVEFYGKALDWHKRLTDDIRVLFHCTVYRSALVEKLVKLRSKFRENEDPVE